MSNRIVLTTILSVLLLTAGTALADETVVEEVQVEEAQPSEDLAEGLESVATMTVSDIAAFFTALTKGISGGMMDDLKQELNAAAEEYENARIFSGSNPDGTQTWNGEVNYYPFLSIFDVQVTVNANDYVVDDVDNLTLNGSMSVRIAGLWNPFYNGLTSLGFPYITYFKVAGAIASTGFMEEELSVYVLIDGTQDPLKTAFEINGKDMLAELKAQAEPAELEEVEQ